MAKGIVSPDGLRSGLEACRRHGGRLGTWLVRLGLVSEGKLLDALAEQSGCPPASTLQLATAPSEVRALIPAAFAKRNLVVAFARQGRNIDVAMIKPNDLLLVDEVSKVTGLIPRPHVATEASLTAALATPAGATAGKRAGVAPVLEARVFTPRFNAGP
jgi:type IV pilus assembly protein PilB